jgi:hypothetical protein
VTPGGAAARAIDLGPESGWGDAWAAAAALLLRQELESAVSDALERHRGADSAPMAAQLAVLRALEVQGAVEIAATWGWLSQMAHAGDPPAEGLRDAAAVITRFAARKD